MIGTLVLGALMGGAVAYFYGDQLRTYLNNPDLARRRVTETMDSVAESMQSAKEGFDSGIGARERPLR
jgi:hypothetical protein